MAVFKRALRVLIALYLTMMSVAPCAGAASRAQRSNSNSTPGSMMAHLNSSEVILPSPLADDPFSGASNTTVATKNDSTSLPLRSGGASTLTPSISTKDLDSSSMLPTNEPPTPEWLAADTNNAAPTMPTWLIVVLSAVAILLGGGLVSYTIYVLKCYCCNDVQLCSNIVFCICCLPFLGRQTGPQPQDRRGPAAAVEMQGTPTLAGF